MMSRFKVGEEITPKETKLGLTYGKFYRVIGYKWGIAGIIDDDQKEHGITDDFGLTRAEYEQAEREKDPFAPEKWVVCVKNDDPLTVGSITQVSSDLHSHEDWFYTMTNDEEYGMRKSHFRPATTEEVKTQEQKVMDEAKDDSAATERQTFTVGGKEFYVGQKVWVVEDGLSFSSGTKFEVIGPVYNAPLALCVRKPSSSMTYFVGNALVSTTPPKPHEWKFGDWARHPEYGVGYVCEVQKDTGYSYVAFGGDFGIRYIGLKNLTYISTAEIPA